MTQAYRKTHHNDYDGVQLSERRPSHGSLLNVERGVPYVPYAGRSDLRQESRTYALPTPIHDLDQESDHGKTNKRASMACSRCRRRKIKCSGGPPCLNCRNAGLNPSTCIFHRVGTKHVFEIDTSIDGSSPMTPMSPYTPVSPAVTYPSSYPGDDRSPALSTFGRSGYPLSCIPSYSYDAPDTPAYSISDDPRPWGNTQRTGTTLSYYEPETPTAYEYPTPLSRVPSTVSEPLSPLNMSNLQSSLPLPFERRLPAPNLVGSLMTPETSDIRSPISARLASLSISNPYTRDNGAGWTTNASSGTGRRQPSIQDLADASMMLPPVTRGLSSAALPASTQDSTGYGCSQASDEMTPLPYHTSNGTLPPLTTGMPPPTKFISYGSENSAPTSTDRPISNTGYYDWAPTTCSGTEHTVIASIETSHHTISNPSSTPDTPTQSRYPPLHHPRPKIVPSSSHAAALEKHDRAHVKETQGSKNTPYQPHSKSSQLTRGSSSKRAAHKIGKESL